MRPHGGQGKSSGRDLPTLDSCQLTGKQLETGSGTAGSSIGALLEEASERLAQAGVEDASREARAIMAALLRESHAHLLAHPEEAVAEAEMQHFEAAIDRRRRREPFAYVVGHREFFGLDFEVSPAVLIPRPETELLVERAIEACQLLQSRANREIVAVDLGTGSGAISIAVAANTSNLRVIAVDSSSDALRTAIENAVQNGVAERIDFQKGNLLENISERIDLLLANLPYIPSADVDTLMPEVALYEPRGALDGGPDGTLYIRSALTQAAARVDPPAAMFFEIGDGQGTALLSTAQALFPGAEATVERDCAGMERLLSIWRTR